MATQHSKSDLQSAAVEVVNILKGIPELADDKVAVIGGLALWTYLPRYRTTTDVDLIVTTANAPQGLKRKLLALPNSPFVEHAQFFYYTRGSTLIQIDTVGHWQTPYVPSAATELRKIPTGSVPYISPSDLIVFKIHSCGMRPSADKKKTDAMDAKFLLEKEAKNGPLALTATQRSLIAPLLSDVVGPSGKKEQWWKEKLGLA